MFLGKSVKQLTVKTLDAFILCSVTNIPIVQNYISTLPKFHETESINSENTA